jgi:hypothetical protein
MESGGYKDEDIVAAEVLLDIGMAFLSQFCLVSGESNSSHPWGRN